MTRRLLEQLPDNADAELIESAAQDAAQRFLIETRADEIASLLQGARTSEIAARVRAAHHAWRGMRLVRQAPTGFVEAQIDLVFESSGGCVVVHYTTRPLGDPTPELDAALLQRVWVLSGTGRRVVEAGMFHLYESAYAPVMDLEARLAELGSSGPATGG